MPPGGVITRSAHGMWLYMSDDAAIERMVPEFNVVQAKDLNKTETNYVFFKFEANPQIDRYMNGSILALAVYFRPVPRRLAENCGWIMQNLVFKAPPSEDSDRALAFAHMQASVELLNLATDGKGAATLKNLLEQAHAPEILTKVYDGKFYGRGKWTL